MLRAILLEGELKGNEVGVVTPYKAQVAVLKQMVQSLGVPGAHAVEVKSVDGFQGREKERTPISNQPLDTLPPLT